MSSNDFSIEDMPVEKLNGPQPLPNIVDIQWITNFDYAISIAYAIMDDTTDGWLGHFIVVIFVEQLEMIGLLCFYRNTFRQKISVET